MSPIQEQINRLERKDWQLWLLTITVLLIFGVFILLTFFYSDLQELYEKEISRFHYNLLFLGFTALSLLFACYVLLKERSIKALRGDLINQKILTCNLENHFRELKALFEVSTLVNSQMELPTILEVTCSTVLKSVQGERLSLWLYDTKKDRLFCAAAYSKGNQRLNASQAKINSEVVSWITDKGQPLLLEEGEQVPRSGKEQASAGTNLFVPLKVKSSLKGILNVASSKDRKIFDQVDLKLVSIFAENVTASLQKSEVYQELKSQARDLEKTLQDLRATQNQLVQSEKLRALGDMAGGVAHDFNNILAVILGRTELLLKEVNQESSKRWLRVIERVANDGGGIIRRLLDFSRTSGEQTCMKVDVNGIIQQVVDITRYRWKNEAEAKGIRIEVVTQLGQLPRFKADPSELSEVLMNMIINAMDAMPQGGKMILKSWEADGLIYISLEDTGTGIKKEDKRRIFDPFFTTKGVKGVGLGLSVAYGIISRYGGEITVESQPDQGSTFVVELPIRESSEEEPPDKTEHPHLQQERLWIELKEEELKGPAHGIENEEEQKIKVRQNGSEIY